MSAGDEIQTPQDVKRLVDFTCTKVPTSAPFCPFLQVDSGKAIADVRETGRDFECFPHGCCIPASHGRGALASHAKCNCFAALLRAKVRPWADMVPDVASLTGVYRPRDEHDSETIPHSFLFKKRESTLAH